MRQQECSFAWLKARAAFLNSDIPISRDAGIHYDDNDTLTTTHCPFFTNHLHFFRRYHKTFSMHQAGEWATASIRHKHA